MSIEVLRKSSSEVLTQSRDLTEKMPKTYQQMGEMLTMTSVMSDKMDQFNEDVNDNNKAIDDARAKNEAVSHAVDFQNPLTAVANGIGSCCEGITSCLDGMGNRAKNVALFVSLAGNIALLAYIAISKK